MEEIGETERKMVVGLVTDSDYMGVNPGARLDKTYSIQLSLFEKDPRKTRLFTYSS